jgi:hypothetical protein
MDNNFYITIKSLQWQDQVQKTRHIGCVDIYKNNNYCQLNIWYAKMWAINHIIIAKIKGSEIYPNVRHTIQRWNANELMVVSI